MDRTPFKNQFPPRSMADWMELIKAPAEQGKGISLSLEKLQIKTYEGFSIDPLSTSEPDLTDQRVLTKVMGPQDVWSEVETWSLQKAAKDLLRDYQTGVRHFYLQLKPIEQGTGSAPSLQEESDLRKLFDALIKAKGPDSLQGLTLAFSHSSHLLDLIRHSGPFFKQLVGKNGDQTRGGIILQADPLGLKAIQGHFSTPLEKDLGRIGELITWSEDQGLPLQALQVNTQIYHHAGASEAQDLAYALSTALSYLRSFLEKSHIPLDRLLSHLSFAMALDADQFMSICKLRAMRILWQRVAQVAQWPADFLPPVYVRTSERMYTRYDPWVNILRSTVAAFSGVIGGARGIIVLPHDWAWAAGDEDARELALKTLWILKNEALLDRVQDPAGGSYSLEKMTQQLALKAWEHFQEIESLGGMEQALITGKIHNDIDQVRQKRMQNIHSRRDPLTGISEYPLLQEALPAKWTAQGPRTSLAVDKVTERKGQLPPLRLYPLGRPFEELRDRARSYERVHGHFPRVFLFSLGRVADYIERTHFMRNFLAAGGFDVHNFELPLLTDEQGKTTWDQEALNEELEKGRLPLVAISAAESVYETQGALMVELIAKKTKTLPAGTVLLAGRPQNAKGEKREWPVDYFVYRGGPAYEILADLWQRFENAKGGMK